MKIFLLNFWRLGLNLQLRITGTVEEIQMVVNQRRYFGNNVGMLLVRMCVVMVK